MPLSDLERGVLSVLEGGGYVPASRIAELLGVSREAVHEAVGSLRRRGFIIEAHPKLGYRLVSVDDLSRANEYLRDLPTTLRYYVHYVERCGSTQDLASRLAEEGAPEGTIVVAEEMYSGRGRLGRRWTAPRGGLWFTLILRPLRVERLHLVTLAMGVAVAKAVRSLLGVDVWLKWPNDVVHDDRKVCGILVESVAEADAIKYLLVGVGVNANNDIPPELRDVARSLKELTGRTIPRVGLLRAILIEFDDLYLALKQGKVAKVLSEWRELSRTIGMEVRVVTVNGRVVEGKALDVDEYGSLMVLTGEGVERVVAGDVYHLRRSRP